MKRPLVRPRFLAAAVLVVIGVPVLAIVALVVVFRVEQGSPARAKAELRAFVVPGATAVRPVRTMCSGDFVGVKPGARRSLTLVTDHTTALARLDAEARHLGWVRQPPSQFALYSYHRGAAGPDSGFSLEVHVKQHGSTQVVDLFVQDLAAKTC